MSSITERINKDGSRSYLAQVRVRGAPRINRTFADRNEACAFADLAEEQQRSQIRMRKIPDLRGFNRESLEDALVKYKANPKISSKNRSTASIIIRNIDNECLEQLDEDWVERYVEKLLTTESRLGTPYLPHTIAQHLTVLSAAYKARAKAFRVLVIITQFSRKLLPKGYLDGRDRRLTRWEERALLSVMSNMRRDRKHWWRLLFRLALETGARQGELVEAPWSEFDLVRRVWNINGSRTKAGKSRWIGLSKRAVRILKCLESLRVDAHPMVFSDWSRNAVAMRFGKLTRKAGLKNFHFHDLRHEAISRMVTRKRQLTVYEIMRMVGHESLSMLNRYANLRPEDLVSRMG